jgi:hypothetical protein
MAWAPFEGFGKFNNALLVGNFGDGSINAFDFDSGEFLRKVSNAAGAPISIPGLWAAAVRSRRRERLFQHALLYGRDLQRTAWVVGLGNEAQVNTAALATLTGSTGGHLFLTGLLASSLDDQFRLRKFFLQILAGSRIPVLSRTHWVT